MYQGISAFVLMPGVDSQPLMLANTSLVPAQSDRGAFGVMTPSFGIAPANNGYVAPATSSSAYVGSNNSAFRAAISDDPTKRMVASAAAQQQNMQVNTQITAQCLLGAIFLTAILTH